MFCFVGLAFCQCPAGDVLFTSQADLNQFVLDYPNCSVIQGNLTIQNGVSDISSLSGLTSVQGELLIQNTSIETIEFDSLISLGPRLEILQNSNLKTVSFLNLTNFFGDLSIWINSVIEEIHGFDNIEELNSLSLNNQYFLTTIPEFNNLVRVNQGIQIIENESLVSFAGFISLSCAGQLHIHGNDILENIPQFNNLTRIDSNDGFGLIISVNSALVNFSGFENLEYSESFVISANGTGNPATIPRFNALKESDHIIISSMGIGEILGFENLEIIHGDLRIDNVGAVNITGFNKLKNVRDIDIGENFFLQNITGFYELKRTNGKLRLFNNNALEIVSGFNIFERVNWDLLIGSNPKLINLDFLSKVMFVGENENFNELDIRFNIDLVDCSGISNLLNYGHLPNDVEISNNGSDCNSISAVIDNGDNDNDGILDSIDVDDDNDGILDAVEQNGNPNLDSDLDLLPDHLDLNSDNDGCSDVMEAGFSDPDSNGTLGAFPDNVNPDGTISDEPDGYTTPLDQDLNSILDFQDYALSPIIQNQPPLSQIANVSDIIQVTTDIINADVFQWQISTDEGQTWNNLIDDAIFSGVNTLILTITILDTSNNNDKFRLGYSNSSAPCNTLAYTESSSLSVFFNAPNAGTDNTLEVCENDSPIDLFSLLGNNAIVGGLWQPALNSGTNMFDPSIDNAGSYRYTITNGSCFSDFSIVTVTIFGAPNAGEDTDIDLCATDTAFDLFQLINGTPDTGGTWSPVLASGTNAFNPSLDASGVYQYTVTNSCGSIAANVNVLIDNNIPLAGDDSTIDICVNDSPINLLDYIQGNPDTSGVISPPLQSNNTIFNPAVDISGTYTYTVTNAICGSDESVILINVLDLPSSGNPLQFSICEDDTPVDVFALLQGSPDANGTWTPSFASGSTLFNPSIDVADNYIYTVTNACGVSTTEIDISITSASNAGQDGEMVICENAAAIDLFNYLNGNPQLGGTWFPELASTTGVFDPQLDSSGLYTYMISNEDCGDVSSTVNVSITELPNAGLDTQLSVCINELEFDVFEQIDGNPDIGGFWTPTLASGTNVYNPILDGPGTYTYTIENDACGNVSSEVIIDVIDVFPITDFTININELSSNNSIKIIINTNLVYEYSIDGVFFQTSNVFENLSGGMYTIYARELNGCGALEETVFLIDYPLFFTPNNDNNNDVWGLKGIDNEQYVVKVFNRYGKLLTVLSNSNPSWDGNYNGYLMPSSDYWFQLEFSFGLIKSGHFTLKR